MHEPRSYPSKDHSNPTKFFLYRNMLSIPIHSLPIGCRCQQKVIHHIPSEQSPLTSHICFNWFILLSGKVIFQVKRSALCPSAQYSRNHLSCPAPAHNRLCLVKQKNMDFLSIVSSCLIEVLQDQKSTASGIWLPAQNQFRV